MIYRMSKVYPKGCGNIDNKKGLEIRIFYPQENEQNVDKKFKEAIFKDLYKQELITENQLNILLKKLNEVVI